MRHKLIDLAVMAGLMVATTLLPVEAWAGDHGWNRHHPGWHERGPHHFTIITQPRERLEIHRHHRHFGHHPGHYGYVVPSQPVWVPAAWYWTGYQWVWVPGYWTW